MQPEEVKRYIDEYRENAARCAYLEREIKDLEILLERMKNNQIADSISITQKWSAAPHGSGVGDPTGQVALRHADGFTPDYIIDLENEIAQKREEYRLKSSGVIYVDSWLKCLSERERYVIESQCIRGAFWRDIVTGFKEKFGDIYSPQGLKKIRTRAMNKIYKIAT